MACQEVAYRDNYLMCLFPHSLGEKVLKGFLHLPKASIVTWPTLAQTFVCHFSFNMENDVTMLDLYNPKQRPNETFTGFLQ